MLVDMVSVASFSAVACAFGALIFICASARAEAQSPPPPPSDWPAIAQAYGERDADCLEWTDSCTICRRRENAEPACSTPGVACLPSDIICNAKRENSSAAPK